MNRELAIATDFADESFKIENIRACMEMIAAAGFTHAHWCFEWDGDYIYALSEMEQIKGWYDEFGLKAKSLHASKGSSKRGMDSCPDGHYRKDYASDIEANRIAGVELIKNRVLLANMIGATEIVLHMYLPYEKFREPGYKETFYRQIHRSLDELQPYCLEKNVRICLENLFEAPGELQIEQFSGLFERYPKEFLGLCLDTGHANLVWGSDFVEKLAKPFADRIYSVHLHDNKGWGPRPGCGDAHRVPGDPDFPWAELMPVLKNSAYENPLVLEVSIGRDESPEVFLKRAYEAGQWLYSLQD